MQNLKLHNQVLNPASHGINVDLNNDGVIGVKEGQLNQDGFVELSGRGLLNLQKNMECLYLKLKSKG